MSWHLILNVSGASMSSLIYDMMNSEGDQEGFLFGSIKTRMIDNISDADSTNETEERSVSIHQYLPCTKTHSFYDRKCSIDEEKLKTILNDFKLDDLIGWYRFRRNSPQDVYYQERTIHANLAKLVAEDKRPYFLFGVFTSSSSNNLATHAIDYSFQRLVEKGFESVDFKVVNLGDTAHNEYKTNSPFVLNSESSSYNEISNTIKNFSVLDKNGSSPSLNCINHIHASFQPKFQEICHQIMESEEEIARLEQELQTLKVKANLLKEDESTEKYSKLITKTLEVKLEKVSQEKIDLELSGKHISNNKKDSKSEETHFER